MRTGRILQQGVVLLAVLAGPSFAGPILIDGRIREPGGAGLAAAEIELRPVLSRFEQGLQEVAGRTPEPVARAVTAADGRFEISAPREGMWEVAVRASGFVPMRYLLTPLLEPASLPAVKLRHDAGLKVRVAGPDGRPLAGARVLGEIAWLWGDSDWPGWKLAPRTATTGKDGTLRLPSTQGELLRLWVAAPGFPAQEGDTVRAPGEAALRVLPGARHDLEARGADGRPVEVVVRDLQSSLPLGRTRLGRLAVSGPAHKETWLLLETANGARVRVPVGPDRRGPVRVAVPPPNPSTPVNPVIAQIVDAESREPIAGGWVWEAEDPGRFQRSDEQGACRFDSSQLLSPARLRATAPGHALAARAVELSENLAPLALDPAVSLVGTVVDETGAPAAGAEVRAVVDNLSFPEEAGRQGRVAASGEVRISGLQPGADYGLIATGAGFAPLRVKIKALEARENRFRLTLRHGRTVSGAIVDAEGGPVAAADVHLVALRELRGMPVWIRDAQGFEEDELRTQSDAAGRFAWADVPAGRYEIFVDRPGFGALRHGAIMVPAGGGLTDLGRLLTDRQPDHQETLSGRVADPEGRPVAGAEVWVESNDRPYGVRTWRPYPAAVSAPDGTFSIRGLSAFSVLRFDVCKDGYVPAKARQRLAGPVHLTLQPGALVTGRLTGPGGLPLPGRRVKAWDGTDSTEHVQHPCVAGADGSETDAAGWFRTGPLEPGRVQIFPGGKPLLLAPGETREIAIADEGPSDTSGLLPDFGPFRRAGNRPRLTAAADLGDLRDLAADPPEAETNVWIDGRILGLTPDGFSRVRAGSGSFLMFDELGAVDAHGAYRLTGVVPGTVELFAQVDGRRVTETVLVPPGESHVTRDLVFPPVARVSGSVYGPGSEPIEAAEVQLDSVPDGKYPQERYPFVTSTRSDGSYSLQVPYGQYDVTVRREGYVSLRRSRQVFAAEGTMFDVNLPMDRSACLSGHLVGLDLGEIPEIDASNECCTETPADAEVLRGTIGADDRYHLCGAGPGPWEVRGWLRVSSSERRLARGKIEIPYRETAAVLDLDFRIGPLTLSGRVQGGEEGKNIWIDLVDAGGHQVVETAPVEKGTFRLERLRAGTYRVRAAIYDQGAMMALAEKEVRLPADQEVTLDLHP